MSYFRSFASAAANLWSISVFLLILIATFFYNLWSNAATT